MKKSVWLGKSFMIEIFMRFPVASCSFFTKNLFLLTYNNCFHLLFREWMVFLTHLSIHHIMWVSSRVSQKKIFNFSFLYFIVKTCETFSCLLQQFLRLPPAADSLLLTYVHTWWCCCLSATSLLLCYEHYPVDEKIYWTFLLKKRRQRRTFVAECENGNFQYLTI